MTTKFRELCQQLRYQFHNFSLLEIALTHTSYANERRETETVDNERFEFLGDAVLDLVISELLMKRFPELPEGGLTKIRAGLVSAAGLSRISKRVGLGQYIHLGKGEEMTGGREKDSILSSTLEAVFAAIYLDSRTEHGIQRVQKVIHHLFEEEIPQAVESFDSHDFKTELQEYIQKQFHTIATYKLVSTSGPDHQKEFEVCAMVDEREVGRGTGSSKKQAEQLAAKEALQQFKLLEKKLS